MRFSITLIARLAGIASLFAFTPASAKTDTQCKREYASKKAAGETRAMRRAADLKVCLTHSDPPPAG
jgi:hypothetical protein